MSDQSHSKRLFKKLTTENWRRSDPAISHFVGVRDGVTTDLDGDDWADAILEIELTPNVPVEVRDLFEVARGALCYGWFFYPLFTLGEEQLYRVSEAALRHKCDQLEMPKKGDRKFSCMIAQLRERGTLPEKRYQQWDASRELRNMSSHPESQSIIDPTMAVRSTLITAELINELFEEAK